MNASGARNDLIYAAHTLRDAGRESSAATILNYAHCYGVSEPELRRRILADRPFGVSIVMPTYLGAERIGKALSSITRQTEDFANFELIVVANGPPDSTDEIIATCSANWPSLNLRFIRSEPEGASVARNVGLDHVNFRYVSFLDDDDYLSEGFIKTLLAHADPNRIVVADIVDFDESGQRPTTITTQVQNLARGSDGAVITWPLRAVGILSMTCAKLAPTSAILRYRFDQGLKSGEDVVFWAHVALESGLRLYAPPDSANAVYHREVRPGSVSRRMNEFEFSVIERLEVISRIEALEAEVECLPDSEESKFIRSRYSGQVSFIAPYLKKHMDRYEEFLSEAERLHISEATIREVNAHLADTLIVSYCFPPHADTSAIVMMKRVLEGAAPVHVISNDMHPARIEDNATIQVLKNRIVHHRQLKAPVSFSSGPGIQAFATEALAAYREIGRSRAPRTIYSRAMWPASNIAAALIKIKYPHLRWVAELSDPIVVDVHGKERAGDLDSKWLATSGLRDAIKEHSPGHAGVSNLFQITELLAYMLAEEVIFTNQNQRSYMLSQEWIGSDIRDRASSIAKISVQPTLPAKYYSIGRQVIDVDSTKVNIGFFGSFYLTRGLREVLVGMEKMRHGQRDRVHLHVASPDPKMLLADLTESNLSGHVTVHPSLAYFDCLASFGAMDYLLVNDAARAGIKAINPYLPSKLSDYLGSGRPIWALEEPKSALAMSDLPHGSIRSKLGDQPGYVRALNHMALAKAQGQLQGYPRSLDESDMKRVAADGSTLPYITA